MNNLNRNSLAMNTRFQIYSLSSNFINGFIKAGQAIKLGFNKVFTAISAVANRIATAAKHAGARIVNMVRTTYNKVMGYIITWRMAKEAHRQSRRYNRAAKNIARSNPARNPWHGANRISNSNAKQWKTAADAYADQSPTSATDAIARGLARGYDKYRAFTRKIADHVTYTRSYRPSRSKAINSDRAAKINSNVDRVDKLIRGGAVVAAYGIGAAGTTMILNSNSKEDK